MAGKSDKPQQQASPFRISEALRERLERAKQLVATVYPRRTLTKQLLESAREDRLDLMPAGKSRAGMLAFSQPSRFPSGTGSTFT